MGAHGGCRPAPDPPAASLQHCEFRMRGHYHCLRTGCCFVTNITTKLPWHIKKHEKAERRAANGFKYFTKREECGRLGTGGWGWGQQFAAGGRGTPLAPEAPLASAPSPGTHLLSLPLRLHLSLKMSQISQAGHCHAGKTVQHKEPRKRGEGDSEHSSHPPGKRHMGRVRPCTRCSLLFPRGHAGNVGAPEVAHPGISFQGLRCKGSVQNGPCFVCSRVRSAAAY